MSPRTKFFAFLVLFAIAATIALSILGTVLNEKHVLDDPAIAKRTGYGAGAAFFGLFLLLSFAIVPLFVRAFLVLQTRTGNGEVWMVKGLRAHESAVNYGFWGIPARPADRCARHVARGIPQTAGEWIQYLQLSPPTASSYSELEFSD